MASPEIQPVNATVLSKIESFLNDTSYKEALENSANYNTRLCIERRMRMPFLDSQTGVAQNHSNLFMSARQRLPGMVQGQIYSYPSKRWRKKRRQYLMTFMQPRRKELDPELDLHTISTVENPAAVNEDSKDSMHLKDETAKDAWYYDDLDMQDVEGYDEPDADSDYDYEDSYSKRKRRRGGKVSRGGGRGRKKAIVSNYDIITDSEKPFACELCGARYKTRPGLTYHYTHSHKDRDDEEDDSSSANNSNSMASSSGGGGSTTALAASSPKPIRGDAASPSGLSASGGGMGGLMGSSGGGIIAANLGGSTSGEGGTAAAAAGGLVGSGGSSAVGESSSSLSTPGNTRRGRQSTGPQAPTLSQMISDDSSSGGMMGDRKKGSGAGTSSSGPQMPTLTEAGPAGGMSRANPSPYCDFCLGDERQNKKTGTSEDLVSCSDCGRSGHPSCLQFTANMIISVRKYRWQCIECKCCTLCGTSDNDDQLLFCDDCDRGYHMYCLNPPLTTPPEGSWSCLLCLDEFHKK